MNLAQKRRHRAVLRDTDLPAGMGSVPGVVMSIHDRLLRSGVLSVAIGGTPAHTSFKNDQDSTQHQRLYSYRGS
jgi:hypothetical protein